MPKMPWHRLCAWIARVMVRLPGLLIIQRWHWHVIWPRVSAQDRPVVAQPTTHVERPHAVGAHVAEGHRRPGLRSWSCAHAGEDIRASSATASSGRCALRDTVPDRSEGRSAAGTGEGGASDVSVPR
jgi:hypothetical protein